jgi:SPP1 family phage portal protein
MIKRELTDGKLTKKQICDIILLDTITTRNDRYEDNERYYIGDNPTIIDKTATEVPDNRIPVPYARKLVLTAKNYLFSREPNYNADDQNYAAELKSTFMVNNNFAKVGDVGEDLLMHGVSYLLFYLKGVGSRRVPAYVVIEGNEIIPVYSYDIEPNLVAAIRYYSVVETDLPTITHVDVYYKKECVKYEISGSDVNEGAMQEVDTVVHGFSGVPLVVYGDEYQVGIFDCVKKIIDAIDQIVSSDVNEIEKFNLAYLVLKGQVIDADALDDIKKKRLFELEKESEIGYLTKQIDPVFNQTVLDFLVSEVHKQTGIPDFAAKDFAAESGIALQYKLIGFETMAADIEAAFKEGEQAKIDLINGVLLTMTEYERYEFLTKNPEKQVTVTLERNLPEDVKAKLENAALMSQIGISTETMLDALPSSVVSDTQKEIKRMEEQKKKSFDEFKLQATPNTTPKEADETTQEDEPVQ